MVAAYIPGCSSAKRQYASAMASSASRPERPITEERSSSPSSRTEWSARSRSRPSSPSTCAYSDWLRMPSRAASAARVEGPDALLVDERRGGADHRVVVEAHLRRHARSGLAV